MSFDHYKKDQGVGKTLLWTSNTIRVDAETGAEITKYDAKTNYIKIKTDKHVQRTNRKGHITYTILYRRIPKQGKLFS